MLTLLLSETTALSMFFSLLLVLFALILVVATVFLSRPTASATAKVVAFGLAIVPIWLGSGLNDDFAYMAYAWLVPFSSYLPLAGVLINLVRSIPKT
ncbi:hypothetical protein [Hymenobacter defluvii]|uniref:Uncharacterized protein n=1 Tax=Hymenobacter defluvii TaxID=2054411 RepID=A0ABS3TEY9_9BACT|nr:hypothetical protein [Hymenobacter defluvii]MBO3272225.1 hypothetical protein [Hymenobacter defluvii]